MTAIKRGDREKGEKPGGKKDRREGEKQKEGII